MLTQINVLSNLALLPIEGNNPRGGEFNDARTNPAPLAEKDGSVKLIYRGGSKGYKAEFIGVAGAAKWEGPYVTNANPAVPALAVNAEDPFVYRDCRGGYHMLAHAIGSGVRENVGMHAFSHDGIHWQQGSPSVAYTDVVAWSDGTNSTLAQRERPVLIFNTTRSNDGGGGGGGCDWVPVALINGARMKSNGTVPGERGEEEDDALGGFPNAPTFTLIVPIAH